MWIPLIVILFGAVGKAIEYVFRRSWGLFITHYTDPDGAGHVGVAKGWPVVVLALLLGYSFFMVLSGGLLFGAIYMATDPVTSPMAPKGAWIFGAGIGGLVVLIRLFGGLPEGVMYAILLMNAATPLIERGIQPRVFGRRKTA